MKPLGKILEETTVESSVDFYETIQKLEIYKNEIIKRIEAIKRWDE